MEQAAQSAILQSAEGQVGAAVRTVAIEQAITALLVPEQHEVLPHQLDGTNGAIALEFVDQGNGLPILAQQGAGRLAHPHTGDAFILLRGHTNSMRWRDVCKILFYGSSHVNPWFMPSLQRDHEKSKN